MNEWSHWSNARQAQHEGMARIVQAERDEAVLHERRRVARQLTQIREHQDADGQRLTDAIADSLGLSVKTTVEYKVA